ncbi:MAG TPA: serine hydrolase domain-containing protein [Gemmatimonadaceae bacterium]|nr:serine hydrolase domain-containing protein [Gemmatimonadaceae bacterium]
MSSPVRATRGAVIFAAAMVLSTGPLGAQGKSTIAPKAPSTTAIAARVQDSLRVVLARAVADGAFPGAVAMVGNRAGVVATFGAGQLDARDSVRPDARTIYDLASLTKVIATTSLMLHLVDRGRVQLDAPVVRYLPEWRGPRASTITVRQLLAHSSGLAAWRAFYKEAVDKADARAQLMLVGPEVPPGTRYLYSDMNFMLLGMVAEKVTGMSLDRAFATIIARPLKLADTRFLPDSSTIARTAPTEFDPWRQRQLRGEVHDENASRFEGVSGHAGLFSTATDLSRIARLWLNRGTQDGVRIASPRTVAIFTRAQDSLVSRRALGWEMATGGNSGGRRVSTSAFGHTGFTGTSIWIDPTRDLFVILLTNRVNPTRENRKIGAVRTALADAVVGAIDGAPTRPSSTTP